VVQHSLIITSEVVDHVLSMIAALDRQL
jgi:hypothetical protein